MKKSYLILGVLLCVSPFFTACNQSVAQTDQGETDQEDDSQQTIIWIGPGWYYGIWFSSEDDFHNWNRGHHRDDDNDRRNDNHGRDPNHENHGGGDRRSGGHR